MDGSERLRRNCTCYNVMMLSVRLATHQLVGTAGPWWDSLVATHEDTDSITWDQFVEAFCTFHIPRSAMVRKAEELRSLKLGQMSVLDSSKCLVSSNDNLIGCSSSVPDLMNDNGVSLDLACSFSMTSVDDACDASIDLASDSLVREFYDFHAIENEDLLDSLIRLRGITNRIVATAFELPKILIVEKILTLLPSSKLLYITFDLIIDKNISIDDVIRLLFKDEEITASLTGKKEYKADNGASSSKGEEVASGSNFFDPSTRLSCSNFYNPYGSKTAPSSSSGASSNSTSSAIPRST
ncbi:hypothetical protein PR202_ga23273 [Eleusine coracana subsp. coracana]|uniref:Retrotransposon gag domain-containing protein n=1 Tax=Eleusine coracana subsp. coracana TaxID=191504 RepID=A0AAV5D5B2_ELECO|nr:hypothetical protein PR202_ga23273 [Eleusine coracana subsp. coracana]